MCSLLLTEAVFPLALWLPQSAHSHLPAVPVHSVPASRPMAPSCPSRPVPAPPAPPPLSSPHHRPSTTSLPSPPVTWLQSTLRCTAARRDLPFRPVFSRPDVVNHRDRRRPTHL